MTFVTLKPNGTTFNDGTPSATTAHGDLSDDSDTTGVTYDPGESSSLTLENLSLPSGAVVFLAQYWLRLGGTALVRGNLAVGGGRVGTDDKSVKWGDPVSVAWTQLVGDLSDSDIDGASIGIMNVSGGIAIVTEAWVRVMYFVQPTVNVASPTGTITTNRPTVSWTAAFDEHAESRTYTRQIRVFTDAQYGAGGFDPDTSTATVEDTVTGTGSSWVSSSRLANDTYRAYVKVASPTLPDHWSDWDYVEFTVNAATPGAPTVTATAASGRIQVQLDDTSGSATTDYFEVQRSEDGGTSWTDVRTVLGDGRVDTSGSPVTVNDWEAPNGVQVTYRARAGNDSNVTVSAWVTDTETWSDPDACWLKHPFRPSLNQRLTVRSYPGSSRAANQGVFRALGASNAIVVGDRRGPETGTIVVFSEDQDARDDLVALLDAETPLLLSTHPSWEHPERWVAIGDTESTRIADHSWVPYHDETLPWTAVDRPEGPLAE